MNIKHKIIIMLVVGLSVFGLFVFSKIDAFALEIVNPLTSSSTADVKPEVLWGRILKAALGFIGVLSLVFFIWGGFLWMTAAGNQEKVKQGMDTLLWSVLGLAAIFASYAILNVVIDVFIRTTIQ
ncbi:MAG: hypothetical protein ABIC82_02105 [bacterium]